MRFFYCIHGSKTPIFWGCQGNYEFEALANALGGDQPLYGIRSLFLLADKSSDNVNSLAMFYCQEILQNFSFPEIILGGFCQASKIIMVISNLLEMKGQRVSKLIFQQQAAISHTTKETHLILGSDRKNEPSYYFPRYLESYKDFYKGYFSVERIPSAHLEHYEPENIDELARRISVIESKKTVEESNSLSSLQTFNYEYDTFNKMAFLQKHYAAEVKILEPQKIFYAEPGSVLDINIKLTNTGVLDWSDEFVKNNLYLVVHSYRKWDSIVLNLQHFAIDTALKSGESIEIMIQILLPSCAVKCRFEIDACFKASPFYRQERTAVFLAKTHRMAGVYQFEKYFAKRKFLDDMKRLSNV